MAAQAGGELNSFPDLPPASAPIDIESAGQGRREATDSARTLKPLGVSGVFAPSLDVGTGDDPVLGPRSYSDDPREVAAFARATVDAYRRAGVLAAATHFPGLGSASQDTEAGPAQVGLSADELRARDLVPFRAAIRAGLQAVVVSHALYAVDDFTVPGSLSERVIGGLLRDELRFKGLAITDDLADPPVTAYTSVPEAAVQAIRAGADMVHISGPVSDQQAAYVALLRAARRGTISRDRLDEAVGRILATKRALKLIR
jgi:beta-N-acetylhexosaminidase